MKKIYLLIIFSPFFIFQSLLAEDSLGNLAQYPPTAKDITITTANDGTYTSTQEHFFEDRKILSPEYQLS